MSVTPSSYVVGIFTDRSVADQSIEALYTAGFGQESIRYSASNSTGFFGDLKSIFTGTNTSASASTDELASDLSTMGLSDEDVQYYTSEYNSGHTIVSVNALNREREALTILNQYGAYGTDVKSNAPQDTSNPVQQPPYYAQTESYPTYDQQNNSVQDSEAQPQVAEEQPLDSYQQDVATPAPDTAVEDESTPATSTYDSDPGNEQSVAITPTETETTDQAPLASQEDAAPAIEDPMTQPMATEETEDATTQPMAAEGDNPQGNAVVPENETNDYQASQSDVVTPENEISNQAEQPEVVVVDDENEEVEQEPEAVSNDAENEDDDGEETTQLEAVVVDNENDEDEAMEQAPEAVSDDAEVEDDEDNATQPEVVVVDDEEVEQEPETASDNIEDADDNTDDPTTEPVTAVYTSETYTPQDSAIVLPTSTPEDETVPEQEVADQTADAPEDETADQTDLKPEQSIENEQAVEAPNYNYGADGQEAQTNASTTEPEEEMRTTPSGKLTPLYANKLQSLQQQLQAMQERLQETKTQLQEAKEHEVQIQQTHQQLQAIQAEFEKTQSELDETHARIEQY